MIAFVVRRLLQSILVMLAVGFIAFALFTYVGDPINNMVGQDTTLEQRQELRERLGLNDPFVVQYGRFLVNAVQASEPGGEIGIETRDWENQGVVIGIRDHGSGISKQNLARVFDPFFTTKRSGGTGLGLSVSYGIIKGYGGDIRVRSELGEGSVFEICMLTEPVLPEPPVDEPVVTGESEVARIASQG